MYYDDYQEHTAASKGTRGGQGGSAGSSVGVCQQLKRALLHRPGSFSHSGGPPTCEPRWPMSDRARYGWEDKRSYRHKQRLIISFSKLQATLSPVLRTVAGSGFCPGLQYHTEFPAGDGAAGMLT